MQEAGVAASAFFTFSAFSSFFTFSAFSSFFTFSSFSGFFTFSSFSGFFTFSSFSFFTFSAFSGFFTFSSFSGFFTFSASAASAGSGVPAAASAGSEPSAGAGAGVVASGASPFCLWLCFSRLFRWRVLLQQMPYCVRKTSPRITGVVLFNIVTSLHAIEFVIVMVYFSPAYSERRLPLPSDRSLSAWGRRH